MILTKAFLPWHQTTALKALRTNVLVITPGQVWLGLTHLVVFEAGPDLSMLSQALPLFRNLKTLALGTTLQPEAVTFPTLHLTELPELSVDLRG